MPAVCKKVSGPCVSSVLPVLRQVNVLMVTVMAFWHSTSFSASGSLGEGGQCVDGVTAIRGSRWTRGVRGQEKMPHTEFHSSIESYICQSTKKMKAFCRLVFGFLLIS